MLELKEINVQELQILEEKLNLKLPIWASAKTTKYYEDRKVLTIWKGKSIKAIYTIPITNINNKIIVDRKLRFFPYVSPIIYENDNIRRREIVLMIFKYIIQNYESLSIPLFPEFKDIAPIQSLGIFAECWHTHTLKEPINIEKVPARLRNHINTAKKSVKIVVDTDYEHYSFEKAIKGPEDEIEIRAKSGINLIKNGNGFFVTGIETQTRKKMGGIMIAYDNNWAYLLHSWRSKEAPRGIIPALIQKATEISFDEKKVKIFDFEGAVIQNIDIFFSGFNAEITTYPYLFWAKDKSEFLNMINDSINIDGRLIEGE